jgi:hypothetical protein
MRLSTSEAKEDSKEARLLSPSAQASLVIYNQIVININFGQNKKEPKALAMKSSADVSS